MDNYSEQLTEALIKNSKIYEEILKTNYSASFNSAIETFSESSYLHKFSEVVEVFKQSIPTIDISTLKNIPDFTGLIKRYPELFLDTHNNKEIKIVEGSKSNHSINIKNTNDVIILKSLFKDISFKDCADFINHLSNFPMLGLDHLIGRKVFQYVHDSNKKQIKLITLFRVRSGSSQKQIPYTENEMFEPQFMIPKQNRFSMVGLNPLYLSECLETAIKETGICNTDKFTWIQLKLKNELSVLDITDIDIPLFNMCHKKAEQTNFNLSIEYLIPNFISDCARFHGFDGISYRSVHDYVSKNLVLFKAGKRDFNVEKIDSRNFDKVLNR